MATLLNNAVEVFLLLFLIITFIQSGVDKLVDWKGNLSWLKAHFSKSLLKNSVPLMLRILILLEMVSGLLCIIGIYGILFLESKQFAFYGAGLSSITLLALLFGQRMAKDYDGARTIVIYFIPTSFLVFLLQHQMY